MDRQETGVRSRKGEVLKVFQDRHEQDGPPFPDALQLFRFMKENGSDLDDLDVGVAIGRLVCEGRLWYDLDGIRYLP